jgi:hypothetical protein
MKKVEAGEKMFPGQDDCWIFFWAKFPDTALPERFSLEAVQMFIKKMSAAISAEDPQSPEELTEKLLNKKGDLVGLLNNVDSTEKGFPTVALISDRFAEWIEERKKKGEIKVDADRFTQKLMTMFFDRMP